MTYERLFKLEFQNQMTIEYLYHQTKTNDRQKAIQTDTYAHTHDCLQTKKKMNLLTKTNEQYIQHFI